MPYSAPALSFATLAGGVWIEETGPERQRTDRCFRFDAQGRAEFATYADLTTNGPRARWFGHQFTAKDFILC